MFLKNYFIYFLLYFSLKSNKNFCIDLFLNFYKFNIFKLHLLLQNKKIATTFVDANEY